MSVNINCRKIRDGIAKSFAYIGGLPPTCPVEGWEYAEFRIIKKGDWFIYKSMLSQELAVGQWAGADGKWNDPVTHWVMVCRKVDASVPKVKSEAG